MVLHKSGPKYPNLCSDKSWILLVFWKFSYAKLLCVKLSKSMIITYC
eukprot:bmy_03069T0